MKEEKTHLFPVPDKKFLLLVRTGILMVFDPPSPDSLLRRQQWIQLCGFREDFTNVLPAELCSLSAGAWLPPAEGFGSQG